MNIIFYIAIFLSLDIMLNLLSNKVFKILGLDFLFLASWLAGINYGIGPGIIVSVILLVEHSLLHPSKSQFILFSFPAQIGAVLLGKFLGMSGFFISLVVYQIINSSLMLITGGFGMFFVAFLVINTIFNVIMFKFLGGFV